MDLVKSLKTSYKAVTGADYDASAETNLTKVIAARDNAGSELTYDNKTLNKRLYDTKQKLNMLKAPGAKLQERLDKETKIRNDIQGLYLKAKAEYLEEPYLMSSVDAEAEAIKDVQYIFKKKMKHLDNVYGEEKTMGAVAESIIKHRADNP